MKYLMTTLCAAILTISANAQKANNDEKIEVREFLDNGKSIIAFPVPDNALKNDLDDVFASVQRDYSFVSEVKINPETNNINVICKKDIGLVDVSQLMKEFQISKYHYLWEVDEAKR